MADATPEACDLADRQCEPCRAGAPPLDPQEIERLRTALSGWQIVEGHHLSKSYQFDDFAAALAFVNRVGEVAERLGHHPDVALSWGSVRLDLWTHKIDGLTESDFVLAAACDRALSASG